MVFHLVNAILRIEYTYQRVNILNQLIYNKYFKYIYLKL